jgi:hypothetical protein
MLKNKGRCQGFQDKTQIARLQIDRHMKGGKKKQATYVDGHHYRKTERQEKRKKKS